MRRLVPATILAVAILASGCDGSPVQPSGLPSPALEEPLPRPAATTTIAGRVVNERGDGVPNATVFTYQHGTVQTGKDGAYIIKVPSSSGLIEAKVEHPGYERDERLLRAVASPQNFLLRDVVRMAPGESRQVTVTPDDSLYGFDFEFKRRTVRVLAPTDATVDFEVVADDSRFLVGLALGLMPDYPCCATRMTVNMRAGQEVSAHALMWWTVTESQTFTVVSRIVH
jgi:hypothetical protein